MDSHSFGSYIGRAFPAPTAPHGSLVELTWRGTEPIELPTGERRTFLEDGDEVTLSGYCERPGLARRIGLGSCRGIVGPA